MGRFKTEILSATFLALLGLSLPLISQEGAQQSNAAPATTTKSRHGSWKLLADGVWEAKVPRYSADVNEKGNPEFAVLRLTADTYAEFQKDHVAFLNKYHVFGKDVLKEDDCSEAKAKNEKPANAFYYLAVPHWPSSTARCEAYPGWSEPGS
jgi:hypothetical protein